MRVNRAIITALLALLFAVSCEQVISLDKGLANAEGSTDQKNTNADGTAGGNPAENIAEGPDSPENGVYNDESASADATVSDADAAVPSTDDGWNEDGTADESSNYSDADNGIAPDSTVSDSDPTNSFSASDCECGESPSYEPICCDGVTTVFNKCFANCINYYTGQCSTQQDGTCATQGGENDSDADTEVSDDDTINIGACGCVPTDMNAWCCDGGVRYISQCAATCECEGTATACN